MLFKQLQANKMLLSSILSLSVLIIRFSQQSQLSSIR